MSYYYTTNQGQPRYQDQNQDTYFDPYASTTNQREPYPTYDQSGYRDDYYQESARPANNAVPQEKDQPFDIEAVNVSRRANPNLKRMKYERDGLWTRGGGFRSCGRFICCTLFIGVWMAIGIILALVLYVRPPNVIIGSAQLPSTNQVQSISNGIRINVDIPISVNNPSYINVDVAKIDAQIFYPINNTHIGNGSLSHVSLPSHSNKTFDFPFSLDWTTDIDPSKAVITDILQKCLAKQDLTVHYDLTVGVRALAVTVSPTINNNISFSCPLDESTLSSLGSGLDLGSIISSLTG